MVLGEIDLRIGDRKRVRACNAALDLQVVPVGKQIGRVGGANVEAGIIARHFLRHPTQGPLGGKGGFHCPALHLLGFLSERRRLLFRVGRRVRVNEVAGNDQGHAANQGCFRTQP